MINLLLSDRAKDYLICDADHPLISGGKLLEELIVYNIHASLIQELTKSFASLSGCDITFNTDVSELSGGQKVILMFLLAIHSSAPRILFIDLLKYLDPVRREGVLDLIEMFSSRKQILLESR
ncbi:MAG: hypothetical protein Q8M98_06100 [Candidatus Cloacimonadaceae bacterium]|nr:hypothetical protein [Candidatus Cloacimonadaceae bacterium]MDP3114334.1 hypothetical protein [Candidatus Cloacimonadaceae bacterium]